MHLETLLERVEECRSGWIYCEESAAEMCLSVAETVYWDVEVIVAGEADGCTSIYDLMIDDGLGRWSNFKLLCEIALEIIQVHNFATKNNAQ